MRSSSVITLLVVLCGQNFALDRKNVDSLVDTIFTKPTPAPTELKRNLALQQGTGGNGGSGGGRGDSGQGTGPCECVPYYLCKDNTHITDEAGVTDIRVPEGPCGRLSVCCTAPVRAEKPVTPPPDTPKSKGCGIRNPDGVGFKITGGPDNETRFGEFPWMVALLKEEAVEGNPQKLLVYQCGASLIHPQVVLTSAHCVTGKGKHYKIRASEWDIQTKQELYPHVERDIQNIVIHPEYRARDLFNDIALLILDKPLEIAETVDVVCLPKHGTVADNSRCYVSGWGKSPGKGGNYQILLKKANLPVVPRDTCQERLRTTRLGKDFQLHASFICAGGEVGRGTCKGDEGSPLVCPIPNLPGQYYQAGIVSWGIGCGEDQIPGVYANVALFSNWIDEQLSNHSLDNSYYKY